MRTKHFGHEPISRSSSANWFVSGDGRVVVVPGRRYCINPRDKRTVVQEAKLRITRDRLNHISCDIKGRILLPLFSGNTTFEGTTGYRCHTHPRKDRRKAWQDDFNSTPTVSH